MARKRYKPEEIIQILREIELHERYTATTRFFDHELAPASLDQLPVCLTTDYPEGESPVV